MPDPVLSARGLTRTYRAGGVEVHALRGVDLDVAKGEMLAIVGPSGCGKTTLLHCAAGLDEPTSGEVTLEGRPLKGMKDAERARHRAARMGFVFQSFNLLPVLTARENVELPLRALRIDEREARTRALESLAAVGLADRADHKPGELSGGQQQRVAIARSLVNDPVLVWADEPTGNLDSQAAADVFGLMRRLNAECEQTYVIVTHDAAIAAGCHRIVRMESGRIAD